MSIALICGYRGMGKDYFFRVIAGKELVSNYQFYIKKGSAERIRRILTENNYKRLPLADAVKEDVALIMDTNVITVDHLKDSKCISCSGTSSLRSYRDILVNYAQLTKQLHGKDYWVRRAASRLDAQSCNVVTDWRFHEDITIHSAPYTLATIRVHNLSGTIPPPKETTEHELDSYPVDLFAFRGTGDHRSSFPLIDWDSYHPADMASMLL